MAAQFTTEEDRAPALRLHRALHWLGIHWVLLPTLILALLNGLPWLAPLFMKVGWTGAADVIYLIYSVLCHQLPHRSFFLFGDQFMISLDTVRALWQDSADPWVLRQFNGTEVTGWKVAWSDRMVYMYASLLLFGILFWPLRQRLAPLSWKGVLLFLSPLVIDGASHMASDFIGGIDGGFRFTNEWLAILTNNAFPTTFYAGDGLGSFNSWLRLITGVLFALGVVWFAFPRLHRAFTDTAVQIETKFQQASRIL